MQRLTPFAQDGSAPGGAQNAAGSALEPLVSVTGLAPWVLVLSFLGIFIVTLIAIIRFRVIKPAELAARDTAFFEPAGADAEITFEPPSERDASSKRSKRKKKDKKRKEKPAQDASEPAMQTGDLDIDSGAANETEGAESQSERRGPFAGLFARGDDHETSSEDAHDGFAETDEPDVVVEDPARAEAFAASANEFYDAAPEETHDAEDAADWQAREEAERQHREFERAEEERRLALEEAERARADAAAMQHRYDEEREAAEREAQFERRKAEAALEQRLQSMQSMQRKLDERAETLSNDAQAIHHRIGASLDQKFSGLSTELYDKLNTLAAQISDQAGERTHDAPGDSAAFDNIIAQIAGELDKLRDAHDDAISRLSDRIDNLSAAQVPAPGSRDDMQRLNKLLAERTAPAVAGVLQLSELVRSALPAERFKFDKKLSSGVKADCMITPPGENAPYAIDARFPVEAFDVYARAQEGKDRKDAETAYRRAVLRHMVFIAEKLISPPETANFAIMFVPSETIFSDLHRNFADIVQDSYRARIWVVAPTSLMATLHMMGAAAAAFAKEKTSSGESDWKTELAAISARLAALENLAAGSGESVRAHNSDAPDESNADTNAAADHEPEKAAAVDAVMEASSKSAESSEEEDGKVIRPPFPLR